MNFTNPVDNNKFFQTPYNTNFKTTLNAQSPVFKPGASMHGTTIKPGSNANGPVYTSDTCNQAPRKSIADSSNACAGC